MHDEARVSNAELRRLLARLAAVELEIEQLRRARESRWMPPPLGVFAVNNTTLAHGGSCTVDRLTRKAAGAPAPPWERTGETFDALDIFFNTADTIEAGYVLYVVPYEGNQVVLSIYCKLNDWIADL